MRSFLSAFSTALTESKALHMTSVGFLSQLVGILTRQRRSEEILDPRAFENIRLHMIY